MLMKIIVIIIGTGVLGGSFYYYDQKVRPVSIAKDAIKSKLNDPESAQWKNVRTVRKIGVCGEVNAKNRLGGYVGFAPFYVLISGDKTFVTIAGSYGFLGGGAEMAKLQRDMDEIDQKFISESCGTP